MSRRQHAVLITEAAQQAAIEAAKAAHPQETGGILIGVLANSNPWITHAIELPSTQGGPTHYTVPRGTTQAVTTARKQDPRVGYLGEWHTHPIDTGPSSTDRATMRHLAWFGTTISPVLLVIRRRPDDTRHLDVHQIGLGRLRRRTLILTGRLSQPEPDHR